MERNLKLSDRAGRDPAMVSSSDKYINDVFECEPPVNRFFSVAKVYFDN